MAVAVAAAVTAAVAVAVTDTATATVATSSPTPATTADTTSHTHEAIVFHLLPGSPLGLEPSHTCVEHNRTRLVTLFVPLAYTHGINVCGHPLVLDALSTSRATSSPLGLVGIAQSRLETTAANRIQTTFAASQAHGFSVVVFVVLNFTLCTAAYAHSQGT